MAAAVGKFCRSKLMQPRSGTYSKQACNLSTISLTKSKKNWLITVGALAGGAGALIYALDWSVKASELIVHPPSLVWPHSGLFKSYDHASIRRGYEVYKQVCSACHGMRYLAYRQLVGVCLTSEEAKRDAAELQIKDGPDDEGNYYMRPGKLSDYFPDPYPNEKAARAANNGAYPPDLSKISVAREGFENYIFHLLTGYFDPPAGHTVEEGQYYNPYFPGGNLSMAKALYDEVIEYSDGTPAVASQLAKDVATFLKWSAETHLDAREYYYLKFLMLWCFLLPIIWYWKRWSWSTFKSRKMVFVPPPKRLK